MKLPRRQFLHLAAGAAALPAVPGIARAQTYPTRPITIIVPFAAGGPNDTIARIISDQMRGFVGQPVIVENAGGASGTIGVGRAARAAGDGYTLSEGSKSSHVLNGALYTLPYDLLKDFVPVARLASEPVLIVARKDLPAKDLSELIAWLRASPGKASQGTPGAGTFAHVTGLFFQQETGTRYQFVPYRGVAPALLDLVAGQIDLIMDTPSNSLPQLRDGRIKAYAVGAKTRIAAAADVPTVDEAGLPGFYASNWYALWAPRGTPNYVIEKLNSAIVHALADPAVRQRIVDLGLEVPDRDQQTPEALGAFQKADVEKWWPIVKAAGIKAE
jgi:tripartite-type tricarboxylate transporter receptor subunit TctC